MKVINKTDESLTVELTTLQAQLLRAFVAGCRVTQDGPMKPVIDDIRESLESAGVVMKSDIHEVESIHSPVTWFDGAFVVQGQISLGSVEELERSRQAQADMEAALMALLGGADDDADGLASMLGLDPKTVH